MNLGYSLEGAVTSGGRGLIPLTILEGGRRGDELEALAAAIRAGDRVAEDRLCALMHARMLEYARSILGGRGQRSEEPEDAVQDSLIRVIRHLRASPERAIDLEGYLLRAVHNRCVDFLRRAAWRRNSRLDWVRQPLQLGEDLADRIASELDGRLLQARLADLEPRCRELLTRLYLQGESAQQVGATMSPPMTAQGVFHRRNTCLKKLLRLFQLGSDCRSRRNHLSGPFGGPRASEGGDDPTAP